MRWHGPIVRSSAAHRICHASLIPIGFLYLRLPPALDSLCHPHPSSGRGRIWRPLSRARSLSEFGDQERERRDQVIHALGMASRLTPALFSKVLTDVCTRFPAPARVGHVERLAQLVVAEAWTEAALFLIELELPLWQLRRLVCDGGEWMCSLSRHPGVPIEIDDGADGRHRTRPIAILLSFVEATNLISATEPARVSSVAQVRPTTVYPFCCDNFG